MNAVASFYATAAFAAVLALHLFSQRGPMAPAFRYLGIAASLVAALGALGGWRLESPSSAATLLRPALAAGVPAALYLHLARLRPPAAATSWRDALHALPAALVLALALFHAPGLTIDASILGVTLAYMALAALLLKREPAVQKAATAANGVRRWTLAVIFWMGVSMLADIAVALEIGGRAGAWERSLALATSTTLLAGTFGYLIVTGMQQKGPLSWLKAALSARAARRPDALRQLEEKMSASKAYLHPDLTLSRFSRIAGVTSRAISETVNDCKRMNFNQWLNSFRIEESKRLMRAHPEMTILDVLLAAGFQNKSTFNAAFKAAAGMAPSAWRNGQTPSQL